MKIIKISGQSDYGNGFGGTGCTYQVEGTDITIEPAAGQWMVKRSGQRVRLWDRFSWAKEHAMQIAIDSYDEPICDKYATAGVTYD